MKAPKTIQNLIELFKKMPGVGIRQATRFAYYFLYAPKTERTQLISALTELEKIKSCPECYLSFDGASCQICANPKRNKKLIAVVEKEIDAETIENTNRFLGVYHVLGGDILRHRDALKINELIERIKKNNAEEIILALNTTTEGDATALHLQRIIKHIRQAQGEPLKITRLARGLPTGGEIEYADENTLIQSLNDRK